MKTCIVIGLIITVDFVSKGYPSYHKDTRLSLYITRKFHTNLIKFVSCVFIWKSWEQGESSGLLRGENGHVYGQNTVENSNVSDTTLRKKLLSYFIGIEMK